jgi:peptide/nickel transport system substrate-binding protein
MRRLTLLFLLLLTLAPFSSIFSQSSDTLIFAHTGNPASLNPLYDLSVTESVPVSLLFAPMFDRDPATGTPISGLTSWTTSDDGLVYTFTIRDDAVWSDGTPITSTDAKFTLEAVKSPLIESSGIGSIAGIQSVDIVDDKTFTVTFGAVDCASFANSNVRFVPAHMFAPDYSDFKDNPYNMAPSVVSGPYVLDEWQPDEVVRLHANPNYWKGKPQIENIILRIMAEPSVLVQSLEAGESDYAWMQTNQLEMFGSLDAFNVIITPTNQILHLSLNWGDPTNPQAAYDEAGNPIEQAPNFALSDVRVRQAIAMGYDKAAILTTLGENGGQLVPSFLYPSSWAYNADIQPWSYDPERAGQLLDEAGWVMNDATGIREKDGVPLHLEMKSTSITELLENTALVVQDQLGDIGIEVTIDSPEYNVWVGDLLGQKYDLAVPMSGIGIDPNGFIDVLTASTADVPGSGLNWDSYVNPRVDELAEAARTVPGCSNEERLPYLREIQQIVHDDVAKDYILVTNQAFVINKRVGNVDLQFGNTVSANFFPSVEKWTLGG